jgi:hypothetical protein
MSNQTVIQEQKVLPENSTAAAVEAENGTAACPLHSKSWLKGGLAMAICCVTPILLFAAFFGLSLGATASGALSLVALLACPIGMYVMMRMMMKDTK